ncbi:glycosyltransferase family 2 protein [Cognatishimia sp. D5M38]|uniref:Glycosyltransferase family 2 protein n=1 Tax=Cognatishimia coralii TaxID=3083254 RepID=A0ABU8QDM3_9RHOB
MKTSIIIPANNEEAWMGYCLDALFKSQRVEEAEVIVVANGCEDRTVEVASKYEVLAAELGWGLKIIDLERGDKLHALNVGERAAEGNILIYLDADVRVSERVIFQITRVLDKEEPAWASGQLQMAAASGVSKAYARFWMKTPFMSNSVPGSGLFAVNRAGRARWGKFPEIISDDMYVRLHFTGRERIAVPSSYVWPVAEGWANLIKVRRRQNRGVAQLEELYPELMKNEDKGDFSKLRILGYALGDPFGFIAYAGVSLIVRLTQDQSGDEWKRGR